MNNLKRFKCEICCSIMVEPTQTVCGCRFCLSCIQNFEGCNCQGCGALFDKTQKLINDVAVKKEIMNSKTLCLNEGCTQTFLYKSMESHLKICEYRYETCKQCHKEYLFSALDEHLSMFCNLAIVKCTYCQTTMTREYLSQVHNNVISKDLCKNMELECPYCCVGPVNLKDHFLKCDNIPFKCPFNELGCIHSRSRDALNIHCTEEHHLTLLLSSIISLKIENAELRDKCIKSDESMISECERLSKANSKLDNTVKELSEKIENLIKHTIYMDSEIIKFSNKSTDSNIFTCKSLINVLILLPF